MTNRHRGAVLPWIQRPSSRVLTHQGPVLRIASFVACALSAAFVGQPLSGSEPIAGDDVVFASSDGVVAVEAEHFFKQSKTDKRKWYLTTSDETPDFSPDGDPSHVAGASGGGYLEILPDSRRNHSEKLIKGENFSNKAGELAVLHYKVHIEEPGRYYVWVRAHSTGSEDNGIHVGIDGEWPEHGNRMQWCQGKQQWWWESKQRTEEQHCGVAGEIYLDIEEAGEHELMFSMREDGFEFDKFLLVQDKSFSRPTGLGPEVQVKSGTAPKPFKFVAVQASPKAEKPVATPELFMSAADLEEGAKGYYLDRGKWLAINPDANESAYAELAFPYASGKYDVTLEAVGEEDGEATYSVTVNDDEVGSYTCPLSEEQFEEGTKFHKTWQSISVGSGDVVRVTSKIASADGMEYSRARVAGLRFRPADEKTRLAVAKMDKPKVAPKAPAEPLVLPRGEDGSGEVSMSGEMKVWHKIACVLDGPYAHENDNTPNPFTDYALTGTFEHESGLRFEVPGYFAADGDAANSSADSGTKWQVNFVPNRPGTWKYSLSLAKGDDVAIGGDQSEVLADYSKTGEFSVEDSDKDPSGRDFRGRGRLSYVGEHYLQFEGTKEYFIKAGPDAPETLLGYVDFDGTEGRKAKVPLNTWKPHVQDWNDGDPTWKDGKGKGLIGALNYLSDKGCNVFSFLPYNAGGDGDNVWPFTSRDDKFHYDCSKLDQWGIVFDHATVRGLYLHFKLQENEIDDNRRGQSKENGRVPESLDGGKLGRERKLYCREIIARFGHALALNWNIGEENTQSAEEQRDMIRYLSEVDPYDHNIVIHTFPGQQDKVYTELLGDKSLLTGASLQNSWSAAHARTLKWRKLSAKEGRPWVVCNDEQNPASDGVPPDPGYQGHDGFAEQNGKKYNLHDVRKQTLWGTLMAGGAGVEYYFGYKLPENDLVCEDFRSRDQSWDYCRFAIEFFSANDFPLERMKPADFLISGKGNHCLAKTGEVMLIYMPNGGKTSISVSEPGRYELSWFNPREGGDMDRGSVDSDGTRIDIEAPDANDWVAVLKRK
ncbi:MAG: DUF5060 domain-containing protein [Planctomycetota bacterium]